MRLLLVYILDISREHTRLRFRTSSGQQHVVRVPVDRQDRRADGLFEESGDPPIPLRIEGTDGDRTLHPSGSSVRMIDGFRDVPSTARDSKLVLVGAPANEGRGTVDTQKHQCRLPDHMSRLRVRALLPNIRVSVLRRSYDAVGLWGPIDRGDWLVMLQGCRVDEGHVRRCHIISAYLSESVDVVPVGTLTCVDADFIRVQANSDLCYRGLVQRYVFEESIANVRVRSALNA